MLSKEMGYGFMWLERGRFWNLDDPEIATLVETHVKGKRVVDLGGAGGSLARVMALDFGAEHVVTVDKEPFNPSTVTPRVSYYRGYFADFLINHPQDFDVAVYSFPPNYLQADLTAIPILKLCPIVIILAINDEGTSCGVKPLWTYLISRRLIHHVVYRYNDLLIYDDAQRPPDQPLVDHEKRALLANAYS